MQTSGVRAAGSAGLFVGGVTATSYGTTAGAGCMTFGLEAELFSPKGIVFSPTGWPFIAGGEARLRAPPPETAVFGSCRLKACSSVVTPPPRRVPRLVRPRQDVFPVRTPTPRGRRPSACISTTTPPTGGGGLRPSPPATSCQAFGLEGGVYAGEGSPAPTRDRRPQAPPATLGPHQPNSIPNPTSIASTHSN